MRPHIMPAILLKNKKCPKNIQPAGEPEASICGLIKGLAYQNYG